SLRGCGQRKHYAGRGHRYRQVERATVPRQDLSVQRVRGERIAACRSGRLHVDAVAGTVATVKRGVGGYLYVPDVAAGCTERRGNAPRPASPARKDLSFMLENPMRSLPKKCPIPLLCAGRLTCRIVCAFLLLAGCVCVVSIPLRAQALGVITGSVTDPSGAAV